jgi:hypothetical protein
LETEYIFLCFACQWCGLLLLLVPSSSSSSPSRLSQTVHYYQCFAGTVCSLLEGRRWRQQVPLKCFNHLLDYMGNLKDHSLIIWIGSFMLYILRIFQLSDEV